MDKQQEAIARSKTPITMSRLTADFTRLGLSPGMTLLVHASLSSMGWVCGGVQAVVDSLMAILTEEGTLVMPTQSFDLSEPSYWQNPPVPDAWWSRIRGEMPAYHPQKTPTRGMGAIAEAFRTFPDVVRSSHPHVSFAAWGKRKDEIVYPHPLDFPLNEASPLGRLYDWEAYVMLLGVSYDSNTAFHLAEYGREDVRTITQGAPIIEDGKRAWKQYCDIEMFSDDELAKLGRAFESRCDVTIDQVGMATCRLFKMKDAVDFARGCWS